MTEAEYLRELAKKCRRLARTINHPQGIADIEAFARELEQRAAELEQGAGEQRVCEC